MQQINFNNSVFSDSQELISALTTLAKEKRHVFRGYGKYDELLPNLMRNKDWRNVEIELLYEFEKYGGQYFSAHNLIDFMSYAQHFGLPTRLLDFTYNPFVALYFALYLPKSSGAYKKASDREYYYLRYCDIDEQIRFKYLPTTARLSDYESSSMTKSCYEAIRTLNESLEVLNSSQTRSYIQTAYWDMHPGEYYTNSDFKGDYISATIQKFQNHRILFIDANQCNQRIVMQQGLFMFPYMLTQDEHKQIVINNTKVIMVNKNIRNELLQYLDTLGINAFRLMPDLSSVCKAVERKITEYRTSKSELFKKNRGHI